MARKIFGPARDFYRVRLTRLDIPQTPLLEWSPDVLYRPTAAAQDDEGAPTTFAIELVNLDTDRSLVLFSQPSEEEAHNALQAVVDDLAILSKAEFDAKYHVVPPVV